MFKRKKEGNIIVLSGPSGSGKTSISKYITSRNSNIVESVSMTTREKRMGETDGVDYYFISKEEFTKRITNDEFLEYAIYGDNYYGTPKENVYNLIKKGIDVILVIEIEGALKIKELVEDAIFIFVLPPSISELKRRLVDRNTETKSSLYKRFQRIYKELNEITKYNYVVINDEVELASKKVEAIIESEKCRVDRIEDFDLNSVEEEIHEYLVELE